MRNRFFPRVSEQELLTRTRLIAQEFHIFDENMLASRLFFLSESVTAIWDAKKKAIEKGEIYIGGG